MLVIVISSILPVYNAQGFIITCARRGYLIFVILHTGVYAKEGGLDKMYAK